MVEVEGVGFEAPKSVELAILRSVNLQAILYAENSITCRENIAQSPHC
jgi:hypothetical protein